MKRPPPVDRKRHPGDERWLPGPLGHVAVEDAGQLGLRSHRGADALGEQEVLDRAVSRASSAVTVMNALTIGWRAPIRWSTASTTATGESCFVRMCRASVSASVSVIRIARVG